MIRPQDKILLSHSEEISDPGSLSFQVELNGDRLEGFLLKINSEFRAYENRCPHTGVNLNWNLHDFFDLSQEFIHCSMHGALFQPLDGKCVYGPCIHQSLRALELVIDSNQVYLVLPVSS